MEEEHEMSSLRARRSRKSSVALSCCFNVTSHHRRGVSFDADASSSSPIPSATPRRSTSTSNKSKTNDVPEIKGKCRNFISRMARHRRHSSAEFSYDPLSYALNFDDDHPPSDDDDFRSKNFAARLPASPPMRTRPFDRHPPRTPVHRSPPEGYYAAESRRREDQALPTPKAIASGNHELRRGFEALSASMKRRTVNEAPLQIKVVDGAEQRRNKAELSSPRAAAVAEVRRSLELEEVTSPVGISSNREILVQLC